MKEIKVNQQKKHQIIIKKPTYNKYNKNNNNNNNNNNNSNNSNNNNKFSQWVLDQKNHNYNQMKKKNKLKML